MQRKLDRFCSTPSLKPLSSRSNLKKKPRSKPIRVSASKSAEGSVSAASTGAWIDILLPSLVGLLTVLAFAPCVRNGFVAWDDEPNLLDNPHYRGLGWNHLQWMFTTFHHSLYRPLTWLSLAVDHALWGMNPAGYHATSVIIHAVNAILFFYLTKRLLEYAAPGEGLALRVKIAAATAAIFFAVHPLRVEPVAWVSARNDILSATFFLLTVIFYLRYADAQTMGQRARLWLAASVAAYACSLLAKASGIGLPFVLLILDWYPLRRFGRSTAAALPSIRLLQEKVPFLILAIAAGVTAVAAKYQAGSIAAVNIYGFGARVAQSLYGIWFYFYKTVLPLNLSPLYQVHADFTGTELWIMVGAGLAIALVGLAFGLRKAWPAVWAGFLCYLIILAPFLGIVQSGPQLVADRYSYLACLSIHVLIGAAVLLLWRGRRARLRPPPFPLIVGCVVVFTVLTTLSWEQLPHWRNTEALWRHALAIDNESDIAHYNLGRALARSGERAAALAEFREALKIQPADPDSHNNVGLLLAVQGNSAEALAEFRNALEVAPHNAEAFFNLGRVYARQGELQQAEQNYREALKLKPDEAEIHLGLANVLMASGASAEAGEHLRRAVELNPDLADAQTAFARWLAADGKTTEAEEHYRRALELLKSRVSSNPRN